MNAGLIACRRFAVFALFASAAIATLGSAQDQTASDRIVAVQGKVRSLAEIGRESEVPGDLSPFGYQMAIKSIDGRVIPILSDEGGRAFYLDESLRNRDVRLKILPREEFPAAEVIQTEVLHEGKWRIPQYYCDVCTIAVRYPQICLCCQGPMEFRFKPER